MTDLKNALWCDLTTDAERSAWLLLGRGHETGVVAKSIQNDLARAYQRLSKTEPQREWVGLTDEEVVERSNKEVFAEAFARGVAWAEAKIKGKNT